MRSFVILFALVASVLAADTADACNRCGLFGRRCRFVHHHQQAVVLKQIDHYQQPSTTLNIVNNYPNALLAPQGTADYGISLANSIQPLGSDFYGKQSARLLEHSVDTLKLSAGLAVEETDHLERLQLKALQTQELATYVDGVRALRAGESNAAQQVLKFHLSAKGIESAGHASQPAGEPGGLQAVFATACARCHSGEKAKGGLQLDDGLTQAELEAMQEQIASGAMPPKESPERAFIDQLRALLGQ